MKTLKLLVLLLFLTSIAKAQDYHPVVGEGLFQWSVPIQQLFDCWIDTVFLQNVDDYYELIYKGKWFYQEGESMGKIRSNENHSQLYFVAPDSEEELLIMDLNLNVGDTFYTIDLYDQPDTLIVDSIFIKDNLKHIQFNKYTNSMLSVNCKKTFIEGVGPNWGLGKTMEQYSLFGYFICKHENGNLIYFLSNSIIDNCNFISPCNSRISNVENNQIISIFPNPANDFIIINISNEEQSMFYNLYNIQGELVGNDNLYDQNKINIAHLNMGVYFLQILKDQKTVIIKKIVKL